MSRLCFLGKFSKVQRGRKGLVSQIVVLVVLVEILEQGVDVWLRCGWRGCCTLWGPFVVAVTVSEEKGLARSFLRAGIAIGWGRDGLVPDGVEGHDKTRYLHVFARREFGSLNAASKQVLTNWQASVT